MRQIIWRFVCLSLITGCGGKPISEVNPLRLAPNTTAYVYLELDQVTTPFNIQLNYWPQFSTSQLQTPSYQITKDTAVTIALTANKPKHYTLDVNGIDIPFFTVLEDTVGMKINLSSGQIDYQLSNVNVNQFLLTNHEIHQSNGQRMLELYHQYDMPYGELFSKLDSIKRIEQDIVKNAANIPPWYRELALQNIELKMAHTKLSAANYRNFIESNEEDLPSDADLKFLQHLDLSTPINQYLDEFNSFMNFYCFYLIYNRHFVNSDSVSLLFYSDELATAMFEACERVGIPDQNFLVFAIDQTIGDIARNRSRKEGRIQYLTARYGVNHPFVSYIIEENQRLEQIGLNAGDKAPYFSLEDLQGNSHMVENYRGKVVLLNFYTPGCVACYKEVPYQQQLQQRYNPEEFKILNICVTESAETFNKAVQKYQLDGLDLYTPGNWKRIVQREYMTSGYPHYTIVNREGFIVKNNTEKPSNPKLTVLLDTLLDSGI